MYANTKFTLGSLLLSPQDQPAEQKCLRRLARVGTSGTKVQTWGKSVLGLPIWACRVAIFYIV
jgi:hypothetical protein